MAILAPPPLNPPVYTDSHSNKRYMLKSKNAKSQYVAPIEHFRMKAKKLMFSDTLTDQFYCRYRNLISHRTFGISLQVISDLIKAITVVTQLQVNLVISKSKGMEKILRVIRSST